MKRRVGEKSEKRITNKPQLCKILIASTISDIQNDEGTILVGHGVPVALAHSGRVTLWVVLVQEASFHSKMLLIP